MRVTATIGRTRRKEMRREDADVGLAGQLEGKRREGRTRNEAFDWETTRREERPGKPNVWS